MLASSAEGNFLSVMSRTGCTHPARQFQSNVVKGSGLVTALSQYIKGSQGYNEMPQFKYLIDIAA